MSLSQREIDFYVSRAVADANESLKEYFSTLKLPTAPPISNVSPKPCETQPQLDIVRLKTEFTKLGDLLANASTCVLGISQLLDAVKPRDDVPVTKEIATMTDQSSAPASTEPEAMADEATTSVEIQCGSSCSVDETGYARCAPSTVSGVKPRKVPQGNVELFVYNVEKGTRAIDIRQHAERYVRVNDVVTVSNVHAKYRSFVMSVSVSDANIVMSQDFWPPYVRCRRFIRPMSGRLARRNFGCCSMYCACRGQGLVVGQTAHPWSHQSTG
jgi:hypothetical protein